MDCISLFSIIHYFLNVLLYLYLLWAVVAWQNSPAVARGDLTAAEFRLVPVGSAGIFSWPPAHWNIKGESVTFWEEKPSVGRPIKQQPPVALPLLFTARVVTSQARGQPSPSALVDP